MSPFDIIKLFSSFLFSTALTSLKLLNSYWLTGHAEIQANFQKMWSIPTTRWDAILVWVVCCFIGCCKAGLLPFNVNQLTHWGIFSKFHIQFFFYQCFVTWIELGWAKMTQLDHKPTLSGNGLVPSGNKPLPEPMLSKFMKSFDIMQPQWVKKSGSYSKYISLFNTCIKENHAGMFWYTIAHTPTDMGETNRSNYLITGAPHSHQRPTWNIWPWCLILMFDLLT